MIMDIHEKETAAEFDATAGSPMFDMIREIESEPVMQSPRRKAEAVRSASAVSSVIGIVALSGILLIFAMAVVPAIIASGSDGQHVEPGGIILLFVIGGIYLLPTIIASVRSHQQVAAIAALNILLGWTLLGWVIAFVWSLTAVRQRA
jgi:hypothetical protein